MPLQPPGGLPGLVHEVLRPAADEEAYACPVHLAADAVAQRSAHTGAHEAANAAPELRAHARAFEAPDAAPEQRAHAGIRDVFDEPEQLAER